MKFNGSVAAGAGRIDYVLGWIRIQEPDLHRFLNFSGISEEFMDGFP